MVAKGSTLTASKPRATAAAAKRPRASEGGAKGPRSVFAVERAADVLKAICTDLERPRGIKELSEMLGMSMSTVHRMITALVVKGFVQKDTSTAKYRAGPWVFDVAFSYLRQLDLPQVALPYMTRLRDETRETVTLSLLQGTSRIYLAQIESPQEIRQTIETGSRHALHLGGSGKAILAFLPEAEIEAYLAAHARQSPGQGAIDANHLHAELRSIRREGFAASRSERLPGAASVAAPVRNHLGAVVGCISISGPAGRFDDACVARYGFLVKVAADEVSRALGAPAQTSARRKH